MRSLRLILLALALLLLGLPTAALAGGNGFSISSLTAQSAQEMDAFWTPERVRQALANPKDLPRGDRGPALGLRAAEPEAPLRVSPGYCPDCSGDPLPAPEPPLTAGATCPASVYEWYFDTDYSSYPERVVGKVLYVGADGGLYSCSAALVEKRLLLTAGHCVSENGVWVQSLIFQPGYLEGQEPYGRGHAEWMTVPADWFHLELPSRDVAFVRLAESLGEQLGWLGLMVNAGRSGSTWQQYGYPAEPPFDGTTLAVNTSAWGTDDCTAGTPCAMGVGSAFTGGSSGGPWVRNQDGNLFANGLNSYYYLSCQSTMYSPYFDDNVWDLFQSAKATQ